MKGKTMKFITEYFKYKSLTTQYQQLLCLNHPLSPIIYKVLHKQTLIEVVYYGCLIGVDWNDIDIVRTVNESVVMMNSKDEPYDILKCVVGLVEGEYIFKIHCIYIS